MKVWHIMKTPFISREKLAEITEQFPTPFHLYDEKGIRERAELNRDIGEMYGAGYVAHA